MPQRDHTTVRPGDEVVVTITGTVATRNTATGTLTIRTTDGALALTPKSDDIHVATVEPERPTLERVLEAHPQMVVADFRWVCGGCRASITPMLEPPRGPWLRHIAEQLREAGVAR